MKKARNVINLVLGSIIAALGLSSCEHADMYGPAPMYAPDPYIDTTAHCMYGVNPNPIEEVNEPETDTNNE